MPNLSSHAGHIPERSCVICKKKIDRSSLLKFVILSEQVIFDIKSQMMGRGYYICNDFDNRCLEHLDKWLEKSLKKKFSKNIAKK
jgi:uncharacterized protein